MIKRSDVNIQKYFKLFESTRTVELRKEEFIKILKDNCKDFLKNPFIIQRNKENYSIINNYTYINPKQHKRTQKMGIDYGGVVSNHSLLLMDNLPSWKDYPKRVSSLIGVTNERGVLDFGEYVYIVIPFDGAIFGVAPDSDIWGCKVSVDEGMPWLSAIGFDDSISLEFDELNIDDSGYQKMIDSLYKYITNVDIDEIKKYYNIYCIYTFINKNGFGDSVLDFEKGLSVFFDPSKFKSRTDVGYKVMNYEQLKDVNDHREVWTESECLVMYIKKIDFSDDGGKSIRIDIRKIFDDFIKSL